MTKKYVAYLVDYYGHVVLTLCEYPTLKQVTDWVTRNVEFTPPENRGSRYEFDSSTREVHIYRALDGVRADKPSRKRKWDTEWPPKPRQRRPKPVVVE